MSTSNVTTANNPTAITSSVVNPRCTSTLSMITWKNRGYQGEELQRERGDEYLRQHLAVLHDGRDEPAEIELLQRARGAYRDVARISLPDHEASKTCIDRISGPADLG